MHAWKKNYFSRLYLVVLENATGQAGPKFKTVFQSVLRLELVYFTHTCVRGFVATRPLYSDVHHRLCLSFMFTFCVVSYQLTLPFPHSWNTDVNLDKELFGLIHRS